MSGTHDGYPSVEARAYHYHKTAGTSAEKCPSQDPYDPAYPVIKYPQIAYTRKLATEPLGVSKGTIYQLARAGKSPATQVGREWRFARQNLGQWVVNGGTADQRELALRTARVGKKGG